jgi:hypothetical protein
MVNDSLLKISVYVICISGMTLEDFCKLEFKMKKYNAMGKVPLQKVMTEQIVQKFLAFYEIRRFITAFRRQTWSLS